MVIICLTMNLKVRTTFKEPSHRIMRGCFLATYKIILKLKEKNSLDSKTEKRRLTHIANDKLKCRSSLDFD